MTCTASVNLSHPPVLILTTAAARIPNRDHTNHSIKPRIMRQSFATDAPRINHFETRVSLYFRVFVCVLSPSSSSSPTATATARKFLMWYTVLIVLIISKVLGGNAKLGKCIIRNILEESSEISLFFPNNARAIFSFKVNTRRHFVRNEFHLPGKLILIAYNLHRFEINRKKRKSLARNCGMCVLDGR